jgi:hypothetical protein
VRKEKPRKGLESGKSSEFLAILLQEYHSQPSNFNYASAVNFPYAIGEVEVKAYSLLETRMAEALWATIPRDQRYATFVGDT